MLLCLPERAMGSRKAGLTRFEKKTRTILLLFLKKLQIFALYYHTQQLLDYIISMEYRYFTQSNTDIVRIDTYIMNGHMVGYRHCSELEDSFDFLFLGSGEDIWKQLSKQLHQSWRQECLYICYNNIILFVLTCLIVFYMFYIIYSVSCRWVTAMAEVLHYYIYCERWNESNRIESNQVKLKLNRPPHYLKRKSGDPIRPSLPPPMAW